MPRLIAEIEKLIEAKEKMAEKNKTEMPKVEQEYIGYAEQKVDYDDKIKKEKNEKKKAEMEKARDVVINKHKALKTKYALMEKAETTIQENLEALKEELAAANKGVEDYAKARREGITMLTREGAKLQTQCDACLAASQDAEQCSVDAEAAAKKADENGAQGARNNANNAVMRTVEASRKAEELIGQIRTTMTATQRNLKAKDFEVMDKDVLVHNNLTKQVQDKFKELEQMASLCPNYVKTAETAAAEATEFANATGVGVTLYQGILDKALVDNQKRIEAIKAAMSAKWGGYITNKGELFTRLLDQLNAKPSDQTLRTTCAKAVEQGQTFLGTTMTKVNTLIQELTAAVRKATQRVPPEYQRALKGKVDQLNMLGMQILNYQRKIESDYAATDIEFQKLATAVG